MSNRSLTEKAQARERLPDRRASTVFGFSHSGIGYVATISRFSDGRIAEIFIDASKPGSVIAEFASDSAVLASLLLQNGITVAAIRHSISRPIATALSKAESEQ